MDFVRLRRIHLSDAPAITRLLEGDTELALQTAAIPIPYTLQCAREFLTTADPQDNLAVTVADELVGMIGLVVAKEPVEIGYWIGRPYWSRGFATWAVMLLVEEARRRGFTRLAAEIFPANPASIRVVEKNGFIRVGEVERHLPQRGVLRKLIRFERDLRFADKKSQITACRSGFQISRSQIRDSYDDLGDAGRDENLPYSATH